MRVILDTNVFVSGIFWSGPPAKILDAWEFGKLNLVLTSDIFEEYKEVGEKLNKKFPRVDIQSILDLVIFHGEFCTSMKLPRPVSNDPDDDKFLACALVSRANIIISGDKDLLDVSGYENIEVIKPGPFVKKYL